MRLQGIIICAFSFIAYFATAQSSISFYSNSELSNLLKIAQEQDKNIFIDTYARWCKPCKKQSRVFMESEVANYFNSNFINVKYDMDTPIGKEIDLKYEVVFLPTLLILDKYGNVRIKMDNGVVGANELLNIAKAVTQPYTSAPVATTPPPIVKTEPVASEPIVSITLEVKEPVIKPTTPVVEQPIIKPVEEATEEKILFVLDGDVELPPEILLKEAYFRMQLMDGTHREAASTYLATQSDWSTEENVKFIHDFVYTTRSDEFTYLIENKELFNTYIGEEKVLNTIELLVYNTLYTGYPRPTLQKATELFGYIDPHNNVSNAQKYFLTRLSEEEDKTKYIEFAQRYLDKNNDKDHAEMFRLAQILVTNEPNGENAEQSEVWINKAIKLQGENINYLEQLAKTQDIKGDKEAAKTTIQKAITLAQEQKKDAKYLLDFLNTLN